MAYQPAQLAAQAYTVIDPRVLLFTAALSIATGVIFGAGPAFFVARFAASSRTATATRRQVRARSALIATQMAVTIVLLTASLALGRSFVKLLTTDNGFELASLATMSVSFAGTSYMANSTALGYYDEVVRRLREIPGVVGVSATGALPLAIDGYQGGSYTIDNGGPPTFTTTFQVAPDYFRTMGGRLIAGREFTAGDLGGQERLAVVSEELARAFGEPPSAVGRLLTTTMGQPRKIIGVVRGMRDSGPSYDLFPQAFFPARAPRSLTIVARVSGDAGDRVAIIRDTVASVDPLVPVFDVKTMDQRLDEALARPKFYATAVVFFGGLALLLSVIGVYGIVSYACGERIREMGIRLALGTTPSRLRVAVVMKTFVAVLLGSLAGMSGAMAASRYLQNLIRGADSGLALMCGVAVAGTMIVAALATWSATRRVAHLDIMEALRPEGS
jgi:predicted permease